MVESGLSGQNQQQPNGMCPVVSGRMCSSQGKREEEMTPQLVVPLCDSPHIEISCSKVCGRITAFTEGTPEGFMRTDDTADINGTYVDGVSLTHDSTSGHLLLLPVKLIAC